ncbi:WD40 repeat domain-containing protein [Winogradskyella sp.]|uniref:WD40 repeat domain-containing protein n=1 Tax=Winogradskyella sp. TaxID=1883156 RepID=UPI003BA93215
MKKLIFALLISAATYSQDLQKDYQLRLEPVWSRVADALGEPGSVESAEISPNNRLVVSGTKYDYALVVWRMSDGYELWRTYHPAEIERAGFSSDSKYVAACSEDFKTTIYDAETGKVVETITHNQGVDGLVWSNTSMLLATGEEYSYDKKGNKQGFIDIYDMDKRENVAHINYDSTINELFFTQDDAYLVAIGHAGIKVYDTKTWKVEKEFFQDEDVIFTAGGFSPDGKWIIAAQNKPNKGDIHLIDWKKGKIKRTFNHVGRKTETVAFHPSGDYVAFTGHSSFIHIYRLADILKYKQDRLQPAVKIWASDHAEYINFNRDGSFMVSAHQNGLIKLWVWMGEDPLLNDKRHKGIKKDQISPETSKAKD